MSQKFLTGWLGYIIITFALGATWHLILFRNVYDALGVYANLDHPNFVLGILSMVIQGWLLSWLFPRFCRGQHPLKEALMFFWLMGLFFGSGSVIAEVAKQHVSSLTLWFLLAGGFTFIHFTLIGLLFGFIYRNEGSSRVAS